MILLRLHLRLASTRQVTSAQRVRETMTGTSLLTALDEQSSGFIQKRMFKGTGVGVEGGCFEAELASGFAPAGNSRKNLTENLFRFGGIETEAWRGCDRTRDGRSFLIFGEGGFAHANTIHFRHGIDVVGR